MKKSQQGIALLILIISLAIVAVLMGLYFTKGSNGNKSQYEQGQEGIEQAKQIQQKALEQSTQIKLDLEQ